MQINYRNAKQTVLENLDDPKLKEAILYELNRKVGEPPTTWKGAKIAIHELIQLNLYIEGRRVVDISVIRGELPVASYKRMMHSIKWSKADKALKDHFDIKGTFEEQYQAINNLSETDFVNYIKGVNNVSD